MLRNIDRTTNAAKMCATHMIFRPPLSNAQTAAEVDQLLVAINSRNGAARAFCADAQKFPPEPDKVET